MAATSPKRKKGSIRTIAPGVALTLLVLLLDQVGALRHLEELSYDLRVRYCQFFSKRPTDRLIHMDVDDRAIESIGKFPWPRARQAELLEELHLAGPKVVALDLFYSQPEDLSESEHVSTTQPSPGDTRFAVALSHLGNTVLAMELKPEGPIPIEPSARALFDELVANLELTESEATRRLLARGIDPAAVRALAGDLFLSIRRDAMYQRVRHALQAEPGDLAAISHRLLSPAADEVNTPLKRLLTDAFVRAQTNQAVERFGFPVGEVARHASQPIMHVGGIAQAPLAPFSAGAWSVGFVDWKYGRQVCRSIPLLQECDGRVYPQFGLVIACRMLDIDPSRIRLEGQRLIIPRPDGSSIRVPLVTGPSERRSGGIPASMDISFFGDSKWENAFDWPTHSTSRQHISINTVWDAVLIRRRLANNNRLIDMELKYMLARLEDKETIEAIVSHPLPPDETDARLAMVQKVLSRPDADAILEIAAKYKPEDLATEDQDFLKAVRSFRLAEAQSRPLQTELLQRRAELAGYVKDKAVLIGWTSNNSLADFVPTALHAKCPGVVVHGSIINAILIDDFWYATPKWVPMLITLLAGLFITITAMRFSPVPAFLVALTLQLAYILVDGIVLFGKHRILLDMASTTIVIVVVWSGCTLFRVLMETRARSLIERRFRSYVDPSLVEYCVEHPEVTKMEGELRELTVGFTDLAGFTTISEKLGAQTVSLLNEYWEHMIPIVRRNRGFVAKFIGDGLFFFYNAPRLSDTHAVDAVQTVLEMQEALKRFNIETAKRGLPSLAMRAGVSSGKAVVGDAGTHDASDYTVLGDIANLGSRLEGANKLFGTGNLISHRTSELCAGQFLLRPMGRVKVVGKTQGILAYEPLCRIEQASDEQKRVVEESQKVIVAFAGSRFAECQAALNQLATLTGLSKFVKLYLGLCDRYLAQPPGEFDGSIVLTDK